MRFQVPAAPTELRVGVDAAVHRDGGYRHASRQAACDRAALALRTVLSAPTRRPYDWLAHDVHYRLMHTIAGAFDPAILLIS